MSFFRDTFHMLVWRVVSLGIGAVTAILIARWLGPDDRGLFALVLVAIGFAALVLQFGMPEASIYLIGARVFATEQALSTLLAYFAALALAACAGGFAVALWWAGAIPRAALIGGALAATILVVALRHLALANRHFIRYSISVSVDATLYLVAILGLRLAGVLSVDAAIGAYLLGQAGALALLLAWLVPELRASFALRHLRAGVVLQGWRHGAHLFATGLGGFGMQRIGYLLLEWLAGTRAVGLFAAASALPALFANLPQQLATVLYSHAATEGAARGSRLAASIFKLMTAGGLLVLGLVFLLREWIAVTLFGVEFAGIGTAMFLLSCGMLVTGLGSILFNALAGAGQSRIGTVLTLTTLAISTLLGIALIPQLALEGAAVAYLGAATVSLAVVATAFCRRLGVRPRDLLLPSMADWSELLRRDSKAPDAAAVAARRDAGAHVAGDDGAPSPNP
jgi:O-antigen/teichoic acid export membrane protein